MSESSYRTILRSSSIMGGAAGVNLLLGMVRVKFAAVLIGTVGVGLNASFGALQGLVGNVAGLGLQSSAVREIAAAVGKNDDLAIGRAVLTLRRLCWLSGLAGMLGMVLLAPLLSQSTFGHRDYALDIAALGVVILFGNLSGGQMATIQGMRRIGDMARANVMGAVFGTMAAVCFYATLGLRGIIPTLLAVAVFQLALSWHFARKVTVPKVVLTLGETFAEAKGMVRLGLVFMLNGLLAGAVAYATIALITQYEGTRAVGLYSAAFALSGMLANFVLNAMGADYYPRLTAAATNPAAMTRMVNEQTEIGLLLALPGLLATLALAPWILQIFYTREFLGAVELLQWFVLGCLARVISWPLGYVMLALGKARYLLISESIIYVLHIILVYVGLKTFGIVGVAYAFALVYVLHVFINLLIVKKLIEFSFANGAARMILFSAAACIFVLMSSLNFEKNVSALVGVGSLLVSLVVSLGVVVKKTEATTRFPLLKKAIFFLGFR